MDGCSEQEGKRKVRDEGEGGGWAGGLELVDAGPAGGILQKELAGRGQTHVRASVLVRRCFGE